MGVIAEAAAARQPSAVTPMKRNGGCAAKVGGDGAPPSKGFEGRWRAGGVRGGW